MIRIDIDGKSAFIFTFQIPLRGKGSVVDPNLQNLLEKFFKETVLKAKRTHREVFRTALMEGLHISETEISKTLVTQIQNRPKDFHRATIIGTLTREQFVWTLNVENKEQALMSATITVPGFDISPRVHHPKMVFSPETYLSITFLTQTTAAGKLAESKEFFIHHVLQPWMENVLEEHRRLIGAMEKTYGKVPNEMVGPGLDNALELSQENVVQALIAAIQKANGVHQKTAVILEFRAVSVANRWEPEVRVVRMQYSELPEVLELQAFRDPASLPSNTPTASE